ncbi:MAG: cyclic nucleotide-binding domain-containing protein, partial [Cyanobacteria bacterium J06576_12]
SPIRSALNYAIAAELALRKVEIPFPQTDLHLKDIDHIQEIIRPIASDESQMRRPTASLSERGAGMDDDSLPGLDSVNLRELLRRITYFAQCHDWELRQLIEYGYRQSFESGEVLFHEGDQGSSFYIVLSGSVEVYLEKLDRKVVATRGVGEFFGEMSLLLDAPRSASIRAMEETLLFVVERSNLQPILKRHPELADHISAELSSRSDSLRVLGIQVGGEDTAINPLTWIRQRLAKLFEL